MCGNVGSKYFTIDDDMIDPRPIIEGMEVSDMDHENIGPFTNAYMSDRKIVCEKLCAIFQQSEDWTYCKSGRKHRDSSIDY